MLRKFLSHDRPTFILRFCGDGDLKKDFFVHRAAAVSCTRLRNLLHTGGESLQDVDMLHSPAKRRKITHQQPTPIIEFHQHTVPAYQRLCRNDVEPFLSWLYHMYAYADNARWHESGNFECAADEMLDNIDDNMDLTCTAVHDESTAGKLISTLALMLYFDCPSVVYEHIENALMYAVRYSDATTAETEELEKIMRRVPVFRHLAAAIHRTCRSLMMTNMPVSLPTFCLVPSPGVHVFSGLQTLGSPHRMYEFDQHINRDGARFLDGYFCEHTLSHEPLLARMQTLVDTPLITADYACGNVHTTESIMMQKNAMGYNNFRFGLIRDLAYVYTVMSAMGEVEGIRMRSPDDCVSISLEVTEDLVLQANVHCVFAEHAGHKPIVRIRVGIINAFESDALLVHEADLDGSLPLAPSHQSDVVSLVARREDQEREKELDIHYKEISANTRNMHQYKFTWRLSLKKLAKRDLPFWCAERKLPPPPRILYVQGGVTFNNAKMS